MRETLCSLPVAHQWNEGRKCLCSSHGCGSNWASCYFPSNSTAYLPIWVLPFIPLPSVLCVLRSLAVLPHSSPFFLLSLPPLTVPSISALCSSSSFLTGHQASAIRHLSVTDGLQRLSTVCTALHFRTRTRHRGSCATARVSSCCRYCSVWARTCSQARQTRRNRPGRRRRCGELEVRSTEQRDKWNE